jgi:hypothetical protein
MVGTAWAETIGVAGKGPRGRLESSRAPVALEWLCFCSRNGTGFNGVKYRNYQSSKSSEGETELTG